MFEYLAGMAKGTAQYNLQLALKAAADPFAEGLPPGCLSLEVSGGGLYRVTYCFQFDKEPRHARGQ